MKRRGGTDMDNNIVTKNERIIKCSTILNVFEYTDNKGVIQACKIVSRLSSFPDIHAFR